MTELRMYDPWGRLGWWSIDPLADEAGQESWSPYNYSFNNPIRYNDPKGDCPNCITAGIGALIGAGISIYDQAQEGTLDFNSGKTWARIGTGAVAGGLAGSGVGLVAGAAIAAAGEVADQSIVAGKVTVTDPTKVAVAFGAGAVVGAVAKGVEVAAVKTGLVAVVKGAVSANSATKVVTNAGRSVVTSNSRQNVKTAETIAKVTKEGVSGVVSYVGGKAANSATKTNTATGTSTSTTTTTSTSSSGTTQPIKKEY